MLHVVFWLGWGSTLAGSIEPALETPCAIFIVAQFFFPIIVDFSFSYLHGRRFIFAGPASGTPTPKHTTPTTPISMKILMTVWSSRLMFFRQDYIDAIWIFKVFKSYGWSLPFIISSILLTTGPKAFLMALALPLGQSTLTFALQRFQNRDKVEPKLKKKTKRRKSRAYSSRNAKIDETEERIRNKGSRKRKKAYQSWIPKNDVSVRSSDGSNFGGWDELDERIESNVEFSTRADKKSNELRGSYAEKGKNGRLRESDGPLLLRLLISIFSFLSSWTKVL